MIKNIIKGFIIGIGKIIPGVSGSMLAISLNVYEDLLNIIANIKKINYNSLKFLLSITIGIITSIIIFSKIIKWSLNKFYIPIMFLFIGLILGGIPEILKKIETKKVKLIQIKYILIFITSFIFSYEITKIGNLNLNSTNNITLFFILGLIESFSSIVPGISGTAIYMSLGVYEFILDLFANLLNFNYLHITIIFIIGVILGIYIIAIIITYLLNHYKNYTFISILGFMSSALIIMIKQIITYITTTQTINSITLQIIISIILLSIGIMLTIIINNLSNKCN